MENQTKSSGGLSFCTVLFIVFLVLKLTHVIGWSWLAVTAPLWIVFLYKMLILALLVFMDYKKNQNLKNGKSQLRHRFDEFNSERNRITERKRKIKSNEK